MFSEPVFESLPVWLDQHNREIAFALLAIGSVIMAAICFFQLPEMAELQKGTILENVFRGDGLTYIVVGCIISLAEAASLIFDLVLDTMVVWKATVDDRWERFITFLLLSVPSGVMVYYRNHPLVPILFCLVHTVQTYGCVVVVASICIQAYPAHFNAQRVLPLLVSWGIACTCSLWGFGMGMFYWINLITYPMCLLSIYLQYRAVHTWLVDSGVLTKSSSSLTAYETYCLSYIGTGCLVVGLVLVIGGATLSNWANFNTFDCIACVYTFCLFSVISAAIPGRTARFAAWEEHKIATWKKTMIRFLSHEIRSPLNVIQTTLQSVVEDMKLIPQFDKGFLDDFSDVQQSCTAAVTLLDSMIQMEQLESGSFVVNLEPCPSASILTMAKRCGIIAKSKGIKLTIHNLLAEDGRADVVAGNTYVLLDVMKMEQILRNLVVNAVKFTNKGGSISITMKQANATDLASLPPLFDYSKFASLGPTVDASHTAEATSTPSEQVVDAGRSGHCNESNPLLSRYVTGANECGIVVEVVDTGVGMSAEQCESVFGEFVQFKPGELQGGEGFGLGLWVCKNIVLLHGGVISCHSRGIGMGCMFRIVLRSVVVEDQVTYGEGLYQPTPLDLDLSECGNMQLPSPHAPPVKLDAVKISRLGSTSTDSEMGSCVNVCDRFLVVDDSLLNRKVVCRALGSIVRAINADISLGRVDLREPIHYEIEVDQCEDGNDAVAAVESSLLDGGAPYAVVVMDNVMSGMHGPQAASMMRRMGFRGSIVGLTGELSHRNSKYVLTIVCRKCDHC